MTGERYKWRLTDLYKDDAEWAEECAAVKVDLEAAQTFKGKLAESPEALRRCLDLRDAVGARAEKACAYAELALSRERHAAVNQERSGKARALRNDMELAFNFVESELMALSVRELDELSHYGELAVYGHYIRQLAKRLPHRLSPEAEELLARLAPVFDAPADMYGMLVTADASPPSYTDAAGNTHILTPAAMTELRYTLPKDEYIACMRLAAGRYYNHKNTLAAALDAVVRRNIIMAGLRGYSGPLESQMHGVPMEVFSNLISTVTTGVPVLRRYYEIVKKYKNVKTLDSYDLAIPIVPEFDRVFPYEEALEIAAEAIKPLGGDLGGYFTYLTERGRYDVYENKGKEPGAFCCSVYGAHSFILMNYHGRMYDLLTLIHEAGHAFHSYMANKSQPLVYTTGMRFTCEIASTVNEILLLEYLTENAKGEEKLYWLDYYINKFRHVLFNFTKATAFERSAWTQAEQGHTLTPELLGRLWDASCDAYAENEAPLGYDVNPMWARYGLFLTSPFYLYQYATSLCAALDIARRIYKGEAGALDGYLAMLSAGSSMEAPEVIALAGVDVLDPGYVERALAVFGGLVAELERTLGV